MPYIATMGTASCACFSIGWFKNAMQANEDYKALEDKSQYVEPKDGLTIDQWSTEILNPTSQPLGRTKNLPFEYIMDVLDRKGAYHPLGPKMVFAVLNEAQHKGDNSYWAKELARHGFKLIDKTQNNWGSVNYIYTRNRSPVAIKKGDE